jgi:hypothetical protein
MNWNDMEHKLSESTVFRIDNNSPKTIVLFGNCHVVVIDQYLNEILECKFNIVVIVSYVFEKKRYRY